MRGNAAGVRGGAPAPPIGALGHAFDTTYVLGQLAHSSLTRVCTTRVAGEAKKFAENGGAGQFFSEPPPPSPAAPCWWPQLPGASAADRMLGGVAGVPVAERGARCWQGD